jgi:Zn-dependent metalloprotease
MNPSTFGLRRVLASTLPVFALLIAAGCSSEGQPSRGGTDPGPGASRIPVGWQGASDETLGTPTFMKPSADRDPVLVPGVTPEEAAIGFFEAYPSVCGLTDPKKELALEEVVTLDSSETIHVIYRQVKGDVPVWGSRIGVHFDPEGRIDFVSGKCVPDVASVDTSPALSKDAATEAAWEVFRSEGEIGAQLQPPSARLVIYGLDGEPRLAWEVSLRHRAAAFDYVIDGKTGVVLASDSKIKASTASGGGVLYHGKGVTSDVKSFQVESFITDPPEYYMNLRGTSSRTEIEIRDSRSCSGVVCSPVSSTSLDSGWDDKAPSAGQAVDAYVYLQEVDQYYRNTHEWASVDGKGIPLIAEVHVKTAYGNAYWAGISEAVEGQPYLWRHGKFEFGDSGSGLSFAGAPDVVAHEFQHGVTETMLGLKYDMYTDGTAIDEHLSDAFAAFYERRYHPGLKPFEMGDAVGNPIRRMDDPLALNHPDCMDKKVKDGRSAHANSNILSHALYLMIMGGTCKTTKERVKYAIGWENAEKLYFALLRTKPISDAGADFPTFARAMVERAFYLPNGRDRSTGPAVAVACAWNAVNVLEEGEIFSNWMIECPQPRDCFGGPACEEGRMCSWNGTEDRYCCKAPPKGEHTCFSDAECQDNYGENLICAQGEDGFYCVERDTDCIPPPLEDE